MLFRVPIFFFFQFVNLCLADHYRGGTISWIAANPNSLVDPVDIYITERHSWTLTRYQCNQTTITTFDVYNDTQSTIPATLNCISSSTACTASLYQTINSRLYCTDFSPILEVSTGTYTSRQSLSLNSSINIAWRGAAWTTELLTNSWSLVANINLTPVSGNKINTSPVTGSLPVIRLIANRLSGIQILAADWDSDQVVRCRWSYQLPLDECGDICSGLKNALIKTDDCFINWTAILRPADIASGLNESTYVVAITAEDFADATSTTPLSSIPHQMLIQVYTPPSSACATTPTIVSVPRRNLACFAVTVNSLFSFTIQARVYCAGDQIVEFVTSSPLYMLKMNMTQVANDTWANVFRWTPRANQTGVQPFCVAAIDNHGVSTTQYCMAMAVGATATTFIQPTFVQGTASPVGTVMRTLSRFSIQANVPIKRTMRDSTQIRIYRNNTIVYTIDAKNSPDVFFINKTLVFFVRNYGWTPGVSYFVVLVEGVATADQYCGMESPNYGSSLFWPFSIWDPSKSSTTTPSTTTSTATTHTISTRSMGTTTYNTLYTTTGIPAYITTTSTSTTSTTSTSVTSTTTTSATSTTTTTTTTTEYIPNVDVIYPKDMEQECVQPATIATVIVTCAIIPLHLYGMINLFVKMNSHFQKEILKSRRANRMRFNNQSIKTEENQTLV